jgi:hypothetical protein
VDAAPLCFFDAAYDALGTATIAANAMAASTLIFEIMRSPPTGVASWQTDYAVRDPHCVPGFAKAEIISVVAHALAENFRPVPAPPRSTRVPARLAADEPKVWSVVRVPSEGLFGWPSSREAEVAAWFDAKTLDEEKMAVRRLNKAAVDHVVYAPIGFYLLHQSWRRNVSGIVKGPLRFFWGVSKAV